MFPQSYLSDRVKTSIAITTANGASGTTEIDGAGLDMSGFDGVLMTVAFGPITSGAATSIKAQQSDDDGSADDYTDVAGTAQTIADTDDNKVFYIDIHGPTKRYVRLVVLRATQAATVGAALYQQWSAHNLRVTQGSNVSGEKFVSPAEGTA